MKNCVAVSMISSLLCQLLLVSASFAQREIVLNHDAVKTLRFSPDGKTLLSAGGEWISPGELKAWNVATGNLKQRRKYEYSIDDIAYSPDGKTIAVVTNCNLQLIDARNWRVRRTFATYSVDGDLIGSVSFSPDGKYIATGSGMSEVGTTGKIRLWNAKTEKLMRILKNSYGLSDVLFSPDSRYVIGIIQESEEAAIKIWNIATGALTREIPLPHLSCAHISPNGKTLVCGTWYQTPEPYDRSKTYGALRWYDFGTGKLKRIQRFALGTISLSWSHNRKALAVLTTSEREKAPLLVLDSDTGKTLRTFQQADSGGMANVEFSPDDLLLANTNWNKNSVRLMKSR